MDPMLYWGMGLLAVAVLLFALEIFVPSGGVLGLISFVVAIAAIVAFWRYSALLGASVMLVVIIMVPVCLHVAMLVMPHTPIGKMLILGGAPKADEENMFDPEPAEPEDDLIGTEGVVLAELRPVGEVRVNGQRYEGHAEEGIIAIGARVIVIDAEGDRLTVRAV